MRSPFRRRKFDSAARVTAGIFEYHAGLGSFSPRRGLRGLSRLGQAIATAEGYGAPGAVPTVANNPGDLELGNIGYGITPAANGNQITNFPTVAAGEAALENQINLIATGRSTAGYSPGMSIAQVGQLYSGGSTSWASNVASALGVTPNAKFASLAGGAQPSATTPQALTPTSDSSIDFSSLTDLLGGSDSSGISPWVYLGVIAVGVATWWAVT